MQLQNYSDVRITFSIFYQYSIKWSNKLDATFIRSNCIICSNSIYSRTFDEITSDMIELDEEELINHNFFFVLHLYITC